MKGTVEVNDKNNNVWLQWENGSDYYGNHCRG